MTDTAYDPELAQDRPENELAIMDVTDQAKSLAGHNYQIRGHLERIYTDAMSMSIDEKTNVVVTRIIGDLNGIQELASEMSAAVQGIAAAAVEIKGQRDKVVRKYTRLRVAVQDCDTKHPDVKALVEAIEDGMYEVETEEAKDRLLHAHPMDDRDASNLMEYLLDDNVPYEPAARLDMIAVLKALIKDIEQYDDPTPEAAEIAAPRNQV